MQGILTDNAIGIISAFILFVITEIITRSIQRNKEKKEALNKKMKS